MHQKLLFLCILSLVACSGEPPLPEIPPTTVSSPVPASPPAAPPAPPGRQEVVVQEALAALGVAYRFGGESPDAGFDCSGLVVHVYREALGLSLPHNARAQSRVGRSVPAGDLEPGDLVFYNTRNRRYSHVGLYLGDGRFIHAPKPGAAVRVENMSKAYWSRRYNGARRIAEPDLAQRVPTVSR
jgi:cell wall-associated NlpC family hydrolase